MNRSISNVRNEIVRRGFTLVELLVVISIISLLMSILMPALQSAREQGMRVDCISNLRQMTLAWQMYATENDDKLCSPDTQWNDNSFNLRPYHWVADGPLWPDNDVGGTREAIKKGVLWEYTQMMDLYKCKRDNSDRLRSYSLNGCLGIDTKQLICGECISCKRRASMLGDVGRPSERMVFIDADASWNYDWIVGPFLPFAETFNNSEEMKLYLLPEHNMTTRHADGCTLSFADGHCDYWKYKDRQTVEAINGEISCDEVDLTAENNEDVRHLLEMMQVQ